MRTFVIVTISWLLSSAAFAQQPSQGTTSLPDFSGIWAHPSSAFEPPLSGPGPVRNKSRLTTGESNFDQLVGDYMNPILQPWAAQVVKKFGEISLTGVAVPDPENQCSPEGVPYILWNPLVQMLQQPERITFLYVQDHVFRHVRMNQPHPARVTPSWYGDSVGHYEGDTLVIDTVGIKVGPVSPIDFFGTPHTEALHVIERYRLLEYEAAKEAQERGEKEDRPSRMYPIDAAYKGKGLQLEFTVEDEGAFTMPWSATVTYRRALGEWPEYVCAENPYELTRKVAVPAADKPDF
jgi:hypothetical protein